MKLYLRPILYTATFLLSAACENEIPYNPGQGQPVLVLNALLETGEHSTNYVFLHQSNGIDIGKVDDDATLRLYINDVLAETPKELEKEETIPYNPQDWPNRDGYEEYLPYIGFKKFRISTQRREAVALEGTCKCSIGINGGIRLKLHRSIEFLEYRNSGDVFTFFFRNRKRHELRYRLEMAGNDTCILSPHDNDRNTSAVVGIVHSHVVPLIEAVPAYRNEPVGPFGSGLPLE